MNHDLCDLYVRKNSFIRNMHIFFNFYVHAYSKSDSDSDSYVGNTRYLLLAVAYCTILCISTLLCTWMLKDVILFKF